MQDQITELCVRLLRAKEAEEARPVARQLQCAIRERLDRVRDNAVAVAIIDRIVDLDFLTTP